MQFGWFSLGPVMVIRGFKNADVISIMRLASAVEKETTKIKRITQTCVK